MGVGRDLFWLSGDVWGSVGMSGGLVGNFLARSGSVGMGARFSKALLNSVVFS